MCLYASVKEKEHYFCALVLDSNRVSSCLPLSSVSCCLEPVLLQVEKSHAFIYVSLMFFFCLFASNAILIKAHSFYVHQSLLLQFDGG